MASVDHDVVESFAKCRDIRIEDTNLDQLLELFLKKKFLFPMKWDNDRSKAYFRPTQFFSDISTDDQGNKVDNSDLTYCEFQYVVDGIVYTINGNGYILSEDEIQNKDKSISYNTVITKLFEENNIQACFIAREIVNREKNQYNDKIMKIQDLVSVIEEPEIEVLWTPSRS